MILLKNIIKLLVVDDEKEFCALLDDLFEDQGYLVEVAYDGEEAVDKAKIFKPDLVLMDIRMPNMDGFAALKSIKECCAAPVIMVTALGDIEIFQKCIELGAHSYVLKPLDVDKLMNLVEETLREESVRKVSPIVWNDEMSVGCPNIDNDHKRLIKKLNTINADFNNHLDVQTIQTHFSDFLSDTREHFEREEKFQSELKAYVSEVEEHKAEHQFLLDEAEELEKHLFSIKNTDEASSETFNLLESFKILWLQHLNVIDLEMKAHLSGVR